MERILEQYCELTKNNMFHFYLNYHNVNLYFWRFDNYIECRLQTHDNSTGVILFKFTSEQKLEQFLNSIS